VAAIQAGRDYLCIEMNEKYILAAHERMKEINLGMFEVDYKSPTYREKYL
jgi:DNA modification methylase